MVDLPTPPFPDATAMTAATPGISACFDIGDADFAAAGATNRRHAAGVPVRWRRRRQRPACARR